MRDSSVTTFISKFLGISEDPDNANISTAEARHELINLTRSGQAGHQNLVHAAHIIFRYQLLDIVADVLGAPRHPSFVHVPRTFAPNFKDVTRLTKVLSTTYVHRCSAKTHSRSSLLWKTGLD